MSFNATFSFAVLLVLHNMRVPALVQLDWDCIQIENVPKHLGVCQSLHRKGGAYSEQPQPVGC